MSKLKMSGAFHAIFCDNALKICESLVRSSSSPLLLLPRFLYHFPKTLNDLDDTQIITNLTRYEDMQKGT